MKWKLSKKKNVELDYIDNESIENFEIDKGINYIVGNNNSGKTRLLDLIKSKDLTVTTNFETPNIVYLTTNSRTLEDENIKNRQIIDGPLIDYIERFNEEPDNITDVILDRFNNSRILKDFLSNKEIFVTKSVSTSISTIVDEISSKNSGSGENRLFYLVYALSALMTKVDEMFEQISFDFSLSRELIQSNLDEEWDAVSSAMNKLLLLKDITNETTQLDDSELVIIQKTLDIISLKGNVLEQIWLFKLFNDRFFDLEVYGYKIKNIFGRENLGLDFENVKNLFQTSKSREKYFNYLEENKDEIVSEYFKNNTDKMGAVPSMDFLVMIDEPENYIHSSKYALINEIFNLLMSIGKKYGIEVRLLINTHDDKILKLNPKYIWNINIAWKNSGIIYYKKIFKNSPEDFVNSLKSDIDEYFDKPPKSDLKLESQIKVLNLYKSIDKKYVEWIMTYKDNLKIFFGKSFFVVEGYHDMLILEDFVFKMNHEMQLIETDGTQEGMLIWCKIIKENIMAFNEISFLIDLDFKKNKDKTPLHLSNTYLMRLYLYNIFQDEKNVKIYSSKFNDITQWIKYLELEINRADQYRSILNKHGEVEKTPGNLDEKVVGLIRSNDIEFAKSMLPFENYKNNYNTYKMNCIVNGLLSKDEIPNLSNGLFNSLFYDGLIFKDVTEYVNYYIKSLKKIKNFEYTHSVLHVIDGELYTYDDYFPNATKYKINFDIEYILPKVYEKIVVSYNKMYLIDDLNKKIIYIHADSYDDIDRSKGESPKVIDFIEWDFSEKYINLFQSNLIKFKIGDENMYLFKDYTHDGKLLSQEEFDKEKNTLPINNLVSFESLGSGFNFSIRDFESGENILLNHIISKDETGYFFANITNSETSWSGKTKISIGPVKFSSVEQIFEEITDKQWVKYS